jgi:hypothetical protein
MVMYSACLLERCVALRVMMKICAPLPDQSNGPQYADGAPQKLAARLETGQIAAKVTGGERKRRISVRHELLCVLAEPVYGSARLSDLCFRSKTPLAVENLFLRNSSGSIRNAKSGLDGATGPARSTLVWPSRWFDWRNALAIVGPRTFISQHARVSDFSSIGNANPAGRGFRLTSNS